MNLRPKRRDAPEINLAPLIDVVFLLLIFFMATTTFKEGNRLGIELPRAEGDPAALAEHERVTLGIDRHGAFVIDGRPLADHRPRGLRRALLAAVGDERDRPLLIKADARTPHQAVMTAMEVAGQLGLVRIQFAATSAVPAAGAESTP